MTSFTSVSNELLFQTDNGFNTSGGKVAKTYKKRTRTESSEVAKKHDCKFTYCEKCKLDIPSGYPLRIHRVRHADVEQSKKFANHTEYLIALADDCNWIRRQAAANAVVADGTPAPTIDRPKRKRAGVNKKYVDNDDDDEKEEGGDKKEEEKKSNSKADDSSIEIVANSNRQTTTKRSRPLITRFFNVADSSVKASPPAVVESSPVMEQQTDEHDTAHTLTVLSSSSSSGVEESEMAIDAIAESTNKPPFTEEVEATAVESTPPPAPHVEEEKTVVTTPLLSVVVEPTVPIVVPFYSKQIAVDIEYHEEQKVKIEKTYAPELKSLLSRRAAYVYNRDEMLKNAKFYEQGIQTVDINYNEKIKQRDDEASVHANALVILAESQKIEASLSNIVSTSDRRVAELEQEKIDAAELLKNVEKNIETEQKERRAKLSALIGELAIKQQQYDALARAHTNN